EMIYQVFNDKNFQKYDEYSELYSGKMLSRIGVDKNTYPKLLQEEIYYESIPCVVFTYTHILSATQHKVSILGIDNQKKIVFHSNPVQILEQKETFTDKYKEWLNKAFSTKRYLDKIDRRNEIVLMLHMAKADGKIEESEKKYLTGVITCLKDFNQKEKAKLFELMNANPLPELVPSDVYFSSDERIEEVKRKISEIMLTDGEEEEKEKLKLQEISTLIENAKATKPKKISVFFKTWQVSIPIILFIIWILTLVLFN
ncbi:MAG: hypothetical protein Q4C75_07485, partial [Bergeyella zoohelcum]|nr:hypothetical protein [Bergeyella zoohelcum]